MQHNEVVEADGAAPAKRAPAIWLFIALDCTSFGVFFLVSWSSGWASRICSTGPASTSMPDWGSSMPAF